MYAAWVEEALGGPIPRETETDCRNCVMAGEAGESPQKGIVFFDTVTRCCTYLPDLPNFLVGRILSDGDAASSAGRASVERRIKAGAAVSPLGLGWPALFNLLYSNQRGFGRSRTLRCPHHLDGGACGIWANRMSICATWFCKHARGAIGHRFWDALQQLLRHVEIELERWCMIQAGVQAETIDALFPCLRVAKPVETLDAHQLDGTVDKEAYAKLWGRWLGREGEFYRRAAELVSTLRWGDVLDVCGPTVPLLAELVRERYREHGRRRVPPRLRVGNFNVVNSGLESTLVVSYSGFDPLRLPRALVEVLPYFDGGRVHDVLRALADSRRLRLQPALIRKLVDFGILESPDNS